MLRAFHRTASSYKPWGSDARYTANRQDQKPFVVLDGYCFLLTGSGWLPTLNLKDACCAVPGRCCVQPCRRALIAMACMLVAQHPAPSSVQTGRQKRSDAPHLHYMDCDLAHIIISIRQQVGYPQAIRLLHPKWGR
jgi:hypothetical protein